MKTTSKKIILLCAGFLLLFVLFFKFYITNNLILKKTDTRTRVMGILKNCKKPVSTLNSIDQRCVYKEFQKFVDISNVSEVMAALMDIFSKEDNSRNLGTNNCHVPAHIAGEVAYLKGATLPELWDTCSNRCTFGCLHGGFQGTFKEKGGGILDNLADSCDVLLDPNDADLRSCWHIVGHGLAEHFGTNMDSAISGCLSLPFEKQQRHCIMGVRMEFIVASVDNNSPMDPLKGFEYLDFCKKFPEKFIDDCYAEASYYQIRITEDVNQMVDICKLVPDVKDSKVRCATGTGSVFFFTNKSTPEAVHNLCTRFDNSYYANECSLGAADLSASEWDHLISGALICKMTSPNFVGECLSYFGERLEYYNGITKRQEICGQLSEIDNKSCMGKPKTKRDYLTPITFSPEER